MFNNVYHALIIEKSAAHLAALELSHSTTSNALPLISVESISLGIIIVRSLHIFWFLSDTLLAEVGVAQS